MDPVQQALSALEGEERALLARLTTVRTAIAAMRPVIARTPAVKASPKPRRGSAIAWTDTILQLLREMEQPLHISEMIELLTQQGFPIKDRKRARDNIVGAVARKAREKKIFKHVGPGTFGLLEWDQRARKNGGARHVHGERAVPMIPTTPSDGVSQSARLLDLIRRNPGRTSGEIVTLYEHETGEDPATARRKRNSRVTRIGQFITEGKVRRDAGKYYALTPAFIAGAALDGNFGAVAVEG